MPTFDHKTHLRVFIDLDLLQWPEVWAAAGTTQLIQVSNVIERDPTGEKFPDRGG